MKNRLILITGPKHSGKSMTALALAKIIGGEAADLDDIVERQTGKTPRALFKEGAEVFRKAETRALASMIRGKGGIIATGGGLIDNNEALALLDGRRDLIFVYLDVSPETAWQRILAVGDELPPFLNTENPRVKPKETHLALHKRRAEAYKALAHLTVFAENKSSEEIAEEILKRCAASFTF